MATATAAKGDSAKAGTNKAKGATGTVGDPSLKRKRGIFVKELRQMMYGFGDDEDPLAETVELMEDIVIEYITDMVHKAQEVASQRGKVGVEDILFLIRKDPRKFARVKELLAMDKMLKEARKVFDDNVDASAPAE